MSSSRRVEPWPIALALCLLAMIGGSLTFLAIASANPDPLVVEDAYVAGLAYNETIRAQRRAEALGLSLELDSAPDADGLAVTVVLRDAAGRAAAADAVTVRRERPAEGGLDADFALSPGGGGFAGRVPLPRPGRWRLIASAEVRGETLRVARDVWR